MRTAIGGGHHELRPSGERPRRTRHDSCRGRCPRGRLLRRIGARQRQAQDWRPRLLDGLADQHQHQQEQQMERQAGYEGLRLAGQGHGAAGGRAVTRSISVTPAPRSTSITATRRPYRAPAAPCSTARDTEPSGCSAASAECSRSRVTATASPPLRMKIWPAGVDGDAQRRTAGRVITIRVGQLHRNGRVHREGGVHHEEDHDEKYDIDERVRGSGAPVLNELR